MVLLVRQLFKFIFGKGNGYSCRRRYIRIHVDKQVLGETVTNSKDHMTRSLQQHIKALPGYPRRSYDNYVFQWRRFAIIPHFSFSSGEMYYGFFSAFFRNLVFTPEARQAAENVLSRK